MLPHYKNYLDTAILNNTEEIFEILSKSVDKLPGIDIHKKLVATDGKTQWRDGCEYNIVTDDIKVIISDYILYMEPEKFGEEIYKEKRVLVKVSGIKKIPLIAYLKNIIRIAKISYILQ